MITPLLISRGLGKFLRRGVLKVSLEFITPNAEDFIGRMAAICYDGNTCSDRNVKRAAKCSEEGHLSTLRFAHAVFNVSEISRVCSHQFVRSKHLDFLQRSQRYCKELNLDFFCPDVPLSLKERYYNSYESNLLLYKDLLKEGVKKEDARFVLPESSYTELNVVGNLQSWKDFIKLRADIHAQKEIREVAVAVNNILSEHCPNLFKRFE
jgi:thymidylate synthase (FAD)